MGVLTVRSRGLAPVATCIALLLVMLYVAATDANTVVEEGYIPVNGDADLYVDAPAPEAGGSSPKVAPPAAAVAAATNTHNKRASNVSAPGAAPGVQGDSSGSGGDSVPPNTLSGNPADTPSTVVYPPVVGTPTRLVFTDTTPTDDEDLTMGSGSGTIPPLSVAYYRSGFTITNVQYLSELNDRSSSQFSSVAENVRIAVEDLYLDLPGEQFVTVLQFLNRSGDTVVQFDLGSVGFYSESALYRVLDTAVRSAQIAEYRVNPAELDFEPLPIVIITEPSTTAAQTTSPFTLTCDPQLEIPCQALRTCLPYTQRCDGFSQCPDGSDEFNCQPRCRLDQDRCPNGACLDITRFCDGYRDCPNGFDEENCFLCPVGQFECDEARCIPDSLTCDGAYDCADRTDEENCPPGDTTKAPPSPTTPSVKTNTPERDTTPVAPTTTERRIIDTDSPNPTGTQTTGSCGADEAYCRSGRTRCVPRDFLCDGESDCDDGSDEYGCQPRKCEPNEFQCANRLCAQKIWRCDGDNDCGDGSDEIDCPTAAPGSPCRMSEFECITGDQCVPLGFQCDGETDCNDRSDEIGCAEPTVTRPPVESINAQEGSRVVITCEAQGIPTPIISWRLNWGPIPERAITTNENGVGTLILENVRESDQGAYTCEAMNNQGYVLAQPDAVLMIISGPSICTGSYFNDDARDPSECIHCYCFGVSANCYSSGFYRDRMTLSFTEFNNPQGVTLGELPSPVDSPVIQDEDYIFVDTPSRSVVVPNYNTRLQASSTYYWVLPDPFRGNLLNSYGGDLQYVISFEHLASTASVPDVFIKGNGITLSYQLPTEPQSGTLTQRQVTLTEPGWKRVLQRSSGGRGDAVREPYYVDATREDFMIALQNVDSILLRATYSYSMSETSLSDISMETAVVDDAAGLGRAVEVEECRCPNGYTGQSCEICAPGYYRVPGAGPTSLGSCQPCQCNGGTNNCDPYTGECTQCTGNTEGPNCERCAEGFFGDPTNGVPCLTCPCPLTDAPNQFSPTCILDTDGSVTCDACPDGYGGRQCETCAPPYVGSPAIPGEICLPSGLGNCHPEGSLAWSGVQCICKDNTEGPLCDRCKAGTYNLAPDRQYGCIRCFCMGVTQDCDSTQQYRSQVNAAFSRDAQGFTLNNRAFTENVTSSELTISYQRRELSFSDFTSLPAGAYYWVLPPRFVGDKVSSYGGYLRYTVNVDSYTGGNFVEGEPDVEISGNGIVLIYNKDKQGTIVQSRSDTSFSVPFLEQYWTRLDYEPANRENLMMALADLEYVIIRATYNTLTAFTSIRDVSLDIAEPRITGQDRAYAVEQCTCPLGYRGLSCQDCDIGFTRSGGGIYLGLCSRCECNRHSTDCHPETGVCRNCRDNTYGSNCELCAPGFYGNPAQGGRCQPCPCPLSVASNQFSRTCFLDVDNYATCDSCPEGYEGRQCERCTSGFIGNPTVEGDFCRRPNDCQCDARGVRSSVCLGGGACDCKENVEGETCNVCLAGFFNLAAANADGCIPCFCSGLTKSCTSANLYRQQLRVQFQSPSDPRNVGLTDRAQNNRMTSGFDINVQSNSIAFSEFSQLANEVFYWELPPKYRGDQITAYGGFLRYTVSFSAAQSRGLQVVDNDVEITGNDIVLQYREPTNLQPDEDRTVIVQIIEDNFSRLDGSPATREHLLMALADLTNILIRATYHTDMTRSSIRDIAMDYAIPLNTGQGRASEVERCDCPEGHIGLSCEDCAPGYTRSGSGLYLGICAPCACNGHSNQCDPESGLCYNCLHNTIGPFCDQCAPGFYGLPTSGTPGDCRQCACPLSVPSNQFSSTCVLDSDGSPTCNACAEGYAGRRCERCADGFEGNPTIPGQTCSPTSTRDRIPRVTISPAEASTSIGGSLTVDVRIVGNYTSARWTRADNDQLSSSAYVDPSTFQLRFSNLQPGDAGIYVFTAYNRYGRGFAEHTLIVLGEAMRVIIDEPTTVEAQEGETIEFVCRGISQEPAYTVAWSRVDGPLPRNALDFMGILTIRSVSQSDAGQYKCMGSNSLDTADAYATLIVRSSSNIEPTVRIEPRFLRVTEGDRVEFLCIATGSPEPTLSWTGGQGGILSTESTFDNGLFVIPVVQASDEAEYFCEATNAAGTASVRTVLYVLPSRTPKVTINPSTVTASEGERIVFYCSATGDPVPDKIWTRVGGDFPSNAREENGYLVISGATYEEEGTYRCSATNSNGVDYEDAQVYINRDDRRKPTARIDPAEVSVNQGATQILRCLTTGVPTPTITWSKNNGPLRPNHQVQNDILRITNADLEDRDMYMCTAENVVGSYTAMAYVEIERREPPRIEIMPESTILATDGENVMFQCRILAGIPTPNITWSRANGSPLGANAQVDYGVLTIMGVTSEDQGSYVCRGSNSAGSNTATVTLRVQGLPQVTITPGSPAEFRVGETVVLECVATGEPLPSVQWMIRNNYQVYEPVASPIIREEEVLPSAMHYIQSVTVNDAGSYMCRAENGAGFVEQELVLRVLDDVDPQPRPPTIDVRPTEMEVVEGATATFYCTSPGTPAGYSITWRRVGQRMPSSVSVSNGVLTIPQAREQFSGQYYCIVGNEFGYEQRLVTLYVLVPPRPMVSPASQIVSAGEILRLSCIAEGTQPIDYDWSKVSGALPPTAIQSEGILQISPVTAADAGQYRCVCTNAAGSRETYSTVRVQVIPTVTVLPARETRAVGGSVEFACQATGIPPPQITWEKEGGTLPSTHRITNDVLRLTSLRDGDEGRYVCTASNPAGSSKAYARLVLHAAPSVQITVHTSVQYIPVGNQVMFECQAKGEPTPMVVWTKVDSELPITVILEGSMLTIPAVSLSDAGLYRCTATNIVGSRTSQVFLYVQSAPHLTVSPTTRTSPRGSTVVFSCQAEGFPPPQITWHKEGGELPHDFQIENGVLTINNIQESDEGTYVCNATNDGGTTEYRAALVVGELIPYFMQMPQSYIGYPRLANAYREFEVEVSFKPESTQGLLIYNGQTIDQSGDFFSFGLSGGHMEFRYELGAGTTVIRSEEPVALGQWHTATIRRNLTRGYLQVDNQTEVQGTAPGNFQGLDLVQNLYLGGVNSFDEIPTTAGFTSGFIGCVSQLIVDGTEVVLDTARTIVGVEQCPTCEGNPCANGGVCEEARAQYGYRCLCPEGYGGDKCTETSGNVCTEGICGEGQCYEDLGQRGFTCVCPIGRTGQRCEYATDGSLPRSNFNQGLIQGDDGMPVQDPSYQGDSYTSYPGLTTKQRQVQIAMMFKTRTTEDSLVLFNGQSARGRGDYIALYIKDNKLVFTFDSGSGPAIIESPEPIEAGRWYSVVAERNVWDGSLQIDNMAAAKGRSPGSSRGLNLRLPLYLGGINKFEELPAALSLLSKGFDGCITEVEIDGEPLDLVDGATESHNIVDCGEVLLCEKQQCLNGATCVPSADHLEYTCQCTQGFTGRHCEMEVGECSTDQPCQHGGSCEPVNGGFICLCSLGYSGDMCEKVESFTYKAALGLSSYLKLPKTIIPRGRGSSTILETISLSLATTSTDGLLLWQGVPEGSALDREDFIALGLRDGYLVFSYQLGSGEASIESTIRIDDGDVHNITVTRRGRDGTMQIDDEDEVRGESGGTLRMLNVKGALYLGTPPDIDTLTGSHYTNGVEACIEDLEIQVSDEPSRVVNLFGESLAGVNVESCEF